MCGHSPLGPVVHIVSTFSSQESFNDIQMSPCPRSVSSVSTLGLTLPPEGDACLARWIPNCPQLEELRVECDSKGEEECTQITFLIFNSRGAHTYTYIHIHVYIHDILALLLLFNCAYL